MNTYKKRFSFFFMPNDEKRFSEDLLIKLPNIRFVDQDEYLVSNLTPSNLSIDQCKSKWIYIWNSDIVPKTEVLTHPQKINQKFGYVLFFERSVFAPNINEEILWSGSLSFSIEIDDFVDNAPINFANTVSQMLRRQNTTMLNCISSSDRTVFRDNVRSYIVGNSVFQWCKDNPSGLLRERSAPNYFWPTSLTLIHGSYLVTTVE